MAKRAFLPEERSDCLNYSAPNCPFPAHRSDFRVDSPTVTRTPGWQMDPDSQIMNVLFLTLVPHCIHVLGSAAAPSFGTVRYL